MSEAKQLERLVSFLDFPTPYQRIIRAAKKGKGIRLTADEVFQMSRDDAIHTRAMKDNDLEKGIYSEED